MQTYRVSIRWSAKQFAKAVANVKDMGATYDAKTKTWLVSADCPALRVEQQHRAANPDASTAVTDEAYLSRKGLTVIEALDGTPAEILAAS